MNLGKENGLNVSLIIFLYDMRGQVWKWCFLYLYPRCLITWGWGRRRQRVKDESHLTECETGSSRLCWTFCREIKEPNKNPMSPPFGVYFSNLILKLLLSIPSKVILFYLVLPTYTHTPSHVQDSTFLSLPSNPCPVPIPSFLLKGTDTAGYLPQSHASLLRELPYYSEEQCAQLKCPLPQLLYTWGTM